jgi:DNA-binding CsgD family transcriptional regulator
VICATPRTVSGVKSSPAARAAARVGRACARAESADDLLRLAGAAIRQAVPYDAALWFGVDPATLLVTAPSRAEGHLDHGYCAPFWHSEFHDHDAAQFRDLARDPVPAATLRGATGGHPARSRRYREWLVPQGLDDELRAVFRSSGNTWGMVGFYRERGQAPFTPDDVAVLSAVSGTLGTALRVRAATGSTAWPAAANAPGLLFFDAEDVLVSANAEAAEWLATAYGPGRDWVGVFADPDHTDILLPMPTFPLLVRARAVAAGHERGPARLRLRDRNGRWLVLHASCMPGTPAGDGAVVVVVEPAKSAEIAPIVIEAYGLTAREREVVRATAQGLSAPEAAAQLHLSPHTVRDYLKSVFEKVGVSSRGELVAKLFAEHYADPMHAAMVYD